MDNFTLWSRYIGCLLTPLRAQLFTFADTYRGAYSDQYRDVICPYYCSHSGYQVNSANIFQETCPEDEFYKLELNMMNEHYLIIMLTLGYQSQVYLHA